MKGDAIEDLALLEGEFTVIGQFLIQEYDTKEFVRNQLIDRDFLEKRGVGTSGKSFDPLLYTKSKNEYYLDGGYVKTHLRMWNKGSISTVISAINKARFKTSDSNGNHLIHTVNGTLVLTPDIVYAVNNGNTKYITDISQSVKTFNQLLTESKPLIEKLAGHYKAHRAMTMTNDRLVTWKQDLLKADGILKKMNSLKGVEKKI